jgi:hypothetical protein
MDFTRNVQHQSAIECGFEGLVQPIDWNSVIRQVTLAASYCGQIYLWSRIRQLSRRSEVHSVSLTAKHFMRSGGGLDQ